MNQVLERGVALPATPVEPYSCIMRHKHEQPEGEALAEAARSAFERVGEQWTDMRAQLFNVIVGLDRPASAYDIADRFSEQRGRRVAANSVYRILDLFVAAPEVERVFKQDRIADFETPTPGYTLVNASVSLKPFANNSRTSLLFSANNIFDVVARRHSSFLKDFAPLAGRDIRVSLRFGL